MPHCRENMSKEEQLRQREDRTGRREERGGKNGKIGERWYSEGKTEENSLQRRSKETVKEQKMRNNCEK